jgi:hypothetical protein
MTVAKVPALHIIISPEWVLSKYLLNKLKQSIVFKVTLFPLMQRTFDKQSTKPISHTIHYLLVRT